MTLEELKKAQADNREAINALAKARETANRDFTAEEAAELEKRLADDATFKADVAAKELAARVDSWRKESTSGAPAIIVKASKPVDKTYDNFCRAVRGEMTSAEYCTAQQQAIDELGGYLNAPQTFYGTLIRDLEASTPLLQNVRYLPDLLDSDTALFPVLHATLTDGYWMGENRDGFAASGVGSGTFSYKEWKPAAVGKHVEFSKKLEMLNPASVQLIASELVACLGRTIETAFVNGDGGTIDDDSSVKPLGIFTASDEGIPTSRDIQTAKAGAISPDDMIDLSFAIEQQYWPGAAYLWSPAMLKVARKWKGGNGEYLFTSDGRKDLIPGAAGQFNGLPVLIVPTAPSTLASSSYAAAISTLSNYWAIGHRQLGLERYDDLTLAMRGTFALLMTRYITGKPVIAASHARLKVR